MAAETKTVTMRLPVEVADFLTRENTSITQAVIDDVQGLKAIRSISASELRGIFTPQEWIFLADSLNGTMIPDSMRFIKGVLIAHNEDAELLDGTATRHGVNVKELNDKINSLYGAHLDAIYCRVENFWAGYLGKDLIKWANF